MSYRTIQTRVQGPACFIRLDRPRSRNAIDACMLDELIDVLDTHEAACSVVVFEGNDDFFCFGADLAEVARAEHAGLDPEKLYGLWQRMAFGPQITVSHVRGQVNAGGIGFVAASDIVIAGPQASFSLSELLFGLLPACVMPFLMRRIGAQRASQMALTTQPVPAARALQWGLVDELDEQSETLLRKQLLRLRRVPRQAIAAHKRFMADADHVVGALKDGAIAANREVFADPDNLSNIRRFVDTGLFPWEARGQT